MSEDAERTVEDQQCAMLECSEPAVIEIGKADTPLCRDHWMESLSW